jgi:putative N6-adenine-specific DNA methylase
MFEYQEKNRFFAQVAGGMEESGAEELIELQARNIQPAYRGIYFEADSAALYRINYTSRLLTRVLAPLISFKCPDTDRLYRKAKSLHWDTIFSPQNTFAIFANVSNSSIRHSRYAALRLKDAIADFFKERFRKRPDVDSTEPDLWINLHIENDRAPWRRRCRKRWRQRLSVWQNGRARSRSTIPCAGPAPCSAKH